MKKILALGAITYSHLALARIKRQMQYNNKVSI